MRTTKLILLSALLTSALRTQAQEEKGLSAQFSLETALQSWVSSGYSFNAYYHLRNSHFSLGVGVEGGTFTGEFAKETIFNNGDLLDEVRLPYLIRGEVRYHLNKNQEGWYGVSGLVIKSGKWN